MSDDGSQKCVQSVEFLVRAYSEWRSMCSSHRSAEVEKARSTLTLNERTRLVTGPACDWERAELRNTFCKNHPELKLKQLGDFDDLEVWLDKFHPA